MNFSDEELRRMISERTVAQPLSAEPVGFLGRLAASFADTPEGKQNILNNLGITGILRDPVGPDIGDIADYGGDVPPALGAAVGTAIGALGRSPAVGAGVGGAAGEFVSQGIGNLLGSQEGVNEQAVAAETMGGMAGERVAGLLPKLANPLRRQSQTANITENVVKPAERFGATNLPADALTESRAVGGAAARARTAATPHGDELRAAQRGVVDGQRRAFEGIASRAGAPVDTPRIGADDLLGVAQDTRQSREDLIGTMFDEARQVMGNTNFPVVVDETRRALRRMAGRRNAGTLRDFNVNSAAQKELSRFTEDVDNIQNFGQMDAFRREVGALLRNPARMEEMSKAGMDLDFRDLYGALKRDLEASVGEGKLAQEFGGQMRGQLREETGRNALGVPTVRRMDNQGARNVNQMQEGVLGERDLPSFPGRESEVARGRIPGRPPVQEARSSTELLDEMSGRVDKIQELRDDASEMFSDLINSERSTTIRLLRDPNRAENVNNFLFRKSGSVENVKALKYHIGAEPTPGGNPASEEGMEAWKSIQAQLFRDIMEEAEDAAANRLPGQAAPLAGDAMENALNRLGGRDILGEAVGPEATDDLYSFARFLRESNPQTRTFSPVSKQAGEKTALTFFDLSLIRRGVQEIFDGVLRRTSFPAQGRMSQYLTEGLAPKQGQQNLLRALGTAAIQPAASDALGVMGATRR